MLWDGIRTVTACCSALTFIWTTTYDIQSHAAEPAQSPTPTIEQLSAACRSAKSAFIAPTDAHLQQAKAELVAAVARLDATLKAAGPGGERWKAFLSWDEMQAELARDTGPDLTLLDAIHGRYASGHNGLDLAYFVDVRRALRRYLTTARAIGSDKIGKYYEDLLDALPGYLEKYHSNPTTDGALLIGGAVQWLEETGQAAELVQAIRDRFSGPNFFLQASADLAAAGIAEPVDTTGPVTDVILGTRISGTEHTTGQLSAELIPRKEFAEISVVFNGTIRSRTVGVNGPARVNSEGFTRVGTRKAIRIDAEHIWTLPAQSNAVTRSTMKNLSVQGGRMAQRTAQQRASSQKGQAEQIAARHAEQRVNQRIDKQADEQIGGLAADFQEKFRQPLLARDLFPQQLRFYTTKDAVHAIGLHGGLAGLGVDRPPPALEGDHELTVRLHESLLNDFAAAWLTGMIVEEETFRAQVTEMLDSTPAWLEPDEETQPWTITLARRRQPISVTFADGGFTVTVRGTKYIRGETAYPGMYVTAAYRIEKTEDGPKAVRQGDIELFPPDFTPGRGKRLSARQQVLRTLLERRFAKIFQEEIVPDPVVLPGGWEKAGQLALVKWEASGGWMTLAWKRIPAQDESAAAPAPAPATP